MRRRGFTLVELLMASAMTVVVLGTLASLYTFTATRATHAIANIGTMDQAYRATWGIEATVKKSVRCEIVTNAGFTALKCLLPEVATDVDRDGKYDRYALKRVSKRGLEKHGKGQRIWFYMAGSSGNFGTSGKYFWRAIRNDDALPTGSDVDKAFSEYYDTGRNQWSLLESVDFSVNKNDMTTTFTVKSSSLARAERRATGTGEDSSSYRAELTRTVFWENWRQ